MRFDRITVATLLLATTVAPAIAQATPPLPEVSAFLQQHPNLGPVRSASALPNWAQGKRQRVQLRDGTVLLFFTQGGRVVSVYRDTASGLVKLWGLSDRRRMVPAIRPSTSAALPAYRILLKTATGAAVLTPSLSRSDSRRERERVCRALAAKLGVSSITLYSTLAAYKANTSAAYKAANPGAIKGFLGFVTSGTFFAGESL